jgi:nucleotide-binding universal stress UspA family protein
MQVVITNRKGEAEEILSAAVKEVGSIPCEIHTEILEGDPASAIIEVAKVRNSDLIVMGSRGLGRLAGLLLGSTCQKVVSHATCPVLIVR